MQVAGSQLPQGRNHDVLCGSKRRPHKREVPCFPVDSKSEDKGTVHTFETEGCSAQRIPSQGYAPLRAHLRGLGLSGLCSCNVSISGPFPTRPCSRGSFPKTNASGSFRAPSRLVNWLSPEIQDSRIRSRTTARTRLQVEPERPSLQIVSASGVAYL